MTQESDSRHSNGSPTSATPRLDAEYRATAYLVFLPETTIALRVDEPAQALDNWLNRAGYATWAFISACNPGSQPLSESENHARHALLVEKVGAMGLPWIKGIGQPDCSEWKPEISLFLPGIDLKKAIGLAASFGQNALLFGQCGQPPQLIYIA